MWEITLRPNIDKHEKDNFYDEWWGDDVWYCHKFVQLPIYRSKYF